MIKFDNKKEFDSYLKRYAIAYEKALVYQLEYAVNYLTNHAKENGAYTDRTSNLRSSIGGAVVKDGIAVTYRGFGDSAGLGTLNGIGEGLELLNSKIAEIGTGYGIVIVAGMEYASYVEDYSNLNVLSNTELLSRPLMIKWLNKVSAAMKKFK